MKVEFSVLMSVYHKESPEYLNKSLQSILDQSFQPSEIVLVKDGELTTSLNKVIQFFLGKHKDLLKVIGLHENVGLGNALNIGLKHCSYEYVARMDTDDICRIDRFENQVNLLEARPEVSIVGSSITEFKNHESELGLRRTVPYNHEDILKYSKKRNPFNHPTVMYKKTAIQEVGGYKHFPYFEDYYLWMRLLKAGYIGSNIDESLVYMRADENMYRRRGGIKYLFQLIKFKNYMRKEGFVTKIDYVISTVPHILIALIPNELRVFLYKHFLRAK